MIFVWLAVENTLCNHFKRAVYKLLINGGLLSFPPSVTVAPQCCVVTLIFGLARPTEKGAVQSTAAGCCTIKQKQQQPCDLHLNCCSPRGFHQEVLTQ